MKTYFRKISYLATMLAVLGLVACTNNTNSLQEPTYQSAETYLKEIGFRGSVLIRKGNKDVVRKGFGLADVANSTNNNPELIYRIGSVTKSFTAAAIIQLKRDGFIQSLDQPLSDFDDEFPLGNQITLRHLLTHQSGIHDYVAGVEDFVEEHDYYIEKEEILEVITKSIQEDGLQFTPGDYFSYSNANYFILGMLIEGLTGKTYQQYLQEKIYTPLALDHTAKSPDEITGTERAKGYYQDDEVAPYQMNIAYSAGELESSLADLEKWGDAMLGDFYTETEKQEFFAAPYAQEDVNVPGAGWFTLQQNNKIVYHHGGDVRGFTSFLVLVPEANGIIVLLSNEQDQGEQRAKILEVILENEF
ncbi:serine hydrolase domain-containing protein [Ochrovirga pacifica]|uniref:serine hydrolase domain-containing protein n=1 Tax=Ochrovirga pacifica TaxID=1042376 RepID=UPI0002558E74|nr:serine hydrolase domain-containing protein [Ochrovirga pacifica]